MKKVISLFAILTLVFMLCACNTTAPSASPTPTPNADKTNVYIDNPIVGQWIPIGAQDPNGFMLFSEDGKMSRVKIDSKTGAQTVEEQGYYLTSDTTFIMVHPGGTESKEYRFEVINDNQTLNIYDNTYNMASEFRRIDSETENETE